MNSTLDISKIIAGVSFILGTLLLVLFLFFKEFESIVMFGLYYVLIAFVTNAFVFFWLITQLIVRSENWIELLKAIGVILINIPIAIVYLLIVFHYLFPTKG